MLVRYSDVSMRHGQPSSGLTPEDLSTGDSLSITPPLAGVDLRPILPVVRLRGVELHAITEKQCIEYILQSLDLGRGGTVVTPNLDILRRCKQDLTFAALVSESDLVVPDGMPLIWASKIQGTPLPQRIAGSDLITTLSLAAAGRGRSIFLLGGSPGSAEGAALVLTEKAPSLKIVGMHCPPMGFEDNPTEMSAMIEKLISAKPDIVWVALGSPKQEFLINRIRDSLPQAWWLGVGISFSFLTGQVKRAPKWLQNAGLEWVHRMIQEPGRLMRRYLLDGLPFAASLMLAAGRNRLFNRDQQTGIGHRFRGRIRNKLSNLKSSITSNSTTITAATIAPAVADTVAAVMTEDSTQSNSDVSIQTRSESSHATGRGLKRLKAVILLGGKVRETELSSSIGRSVLDLPLDEHNSILNHWVSQCADLSERVGLNDLRVRIMVDHKAMEPKSVDSKYADIYRVERDRSSFRGTGGLLADLAQDYADDDLILVGNANQVLLDPLWAIASALDHKTGDITLISHRDGTASGLMLLACKTLRSISNVGYVDMKEQALPKIAQSHEVRVVHCREATGLPLFSLNDYITALHSHSRRQGQRRARAMPFSEDFSRRFAIVEEGATVDASAYLHDSVVLKGAVIEPGAAVIRSLVCPGALVRRNRQTMDQLVSNLG